MAGQRASPLASFAIAPTVERILSKEVSVAILRVAQMGHPVLRMVAEPIDPDLIGSDDFQRFCDDMLDTMDEYNGAGLAAPQVHEPIRVVCLTIDPDVGPEFLINPEIEALTEATSRTVEGCLSVSGLRAAVDRPNHIRVRAWGRDGRRKHYELKGFPAVVTQHECDHLDGILYVDRADPLTFAFLPEYEKYGSLDQYVEGEAASDDIADEIILLDPEAEAPAEDNS